MRYVRLWDRGGGGVGGTGGNRNKTTTAYTLEEELELAAYNQLIWDKIDECHRTATGSTTGDAKLDEELHLELDRVTVLPRLLECGSLFCTTEVQEAVQWFWDHCMTPELKHDTHGAWALIRAAAALDPPSASIKGGGFAASQWRSPRLLLPFQVMLWTDEGCPLRRDRDLLLASLEGGGLDIDLPWSSLLENDREILLKVFACSPWSLDDADIPLWCLEDREVFLSFLRSKRLENYRNLSRRCSTAVNRFSQKLLHDPGVLAELLSSSDIWSRDMVARSEVFSDATQHPLLDDLEFVLLAVDRMRADKTYNRRNCPLRYDRLSLRLQASRDVILAFAALDPEFWAGRSIRAGERSGPERDLRHLPFPQEVTTDRDAAVRMVFLRSIVDGFTCEDWSTVERVQDRDFWIQMAETHLCPVRGWEFIPKDVASDPAVILAWARHATFLTSEWILWADGKARVLSDRQALHNCLPQLWESHDPRIWCRIDPRVLDATCWVGVLSRTDARHAGLVLPLLSNELRNNFVVLGALLRCGMKRLRDFIGVFRNLPSSIQVHFADLLVEALRIGFDGWLPEAFKELYLGLFDVPEVVDAALSRGWRPSKQVRFRTIVSFAQWSEDATFLLSLARRFPAESVWACFSDDVRRNKDLMVEATRLNPGLWWYLSEDLKYDFDVLSGALSASGGVLLHGLPRQDAVTCRATPNVRLLAYAREVRRRLFLHASLAALMGGIRRRPSFSSTAATPLTVLNQGPDFLDALRGRFAALLGAPTDPNEIAEGRTASNALTRHGY